ncbi:hypothetical protein BU23DRAFT_24987 [Bimuria novae-zelandiae CBS 107.79]|uniref:Uncharacterized protein n=1 Tax=Bimuria novae-zelandiae CBS 107.79 TaxID=1447943 RepID=A0A6A5UM50_9PLEO|nr:hypothetical protein BU23DRAFT_24987 [Bimuria novae-zelandiae CBS 107.79]
MTSSSSGMRLMLHPMSCRRMHTTPVMNTVATKVLISVDERISLLQFRPGAGMGRSSAQHGLEMR